MIRVPWGFPSQFHRIFWATSSSQSRDKRSRICEIEHIVWLKTLKAKLFHQFCFHPMLIIPKFSYVSIPSYYYTIWSILSLTSIRASSWANSKLSIPNVFNPLSLPVLLTPSWRPPAIMRGFGTGSLKLLHAFKKERWNSIEVDNSALWVCLKIGFPEIWESIIIFPITMAWFP